MVEYVLAAAPATVLCAFEDTQSTIELLIAFI